MTLRALSPSVSAAGAAAPVMSKLEGLPFGAFGSITVLIFLLAFPALVGGARRRSETIEKIAARTARRQSCVSGTSWLAGRRESPRAERVSSRLSRHRRPARSKRREEYTRRFCLSRV